MEAALKKQEQKARKAEEKAKIKAKKAEERAKRMKKAEEERKVREQKRKEKREALRRERAHEKANRAQARSKAQQHRKEKRENREHGYGGWLAAVVALGAVTLALTTAVTIGAIEMKRTNDTMMTGHRSTAYELIGIIEHVDEDLDRARVSASIPQQERILTDLLVQARLAELDLEKMPIDIERNRNLTKFINRVAHESERMLAVLRNGGTLSKDDQATLQELYEKAHTARERLDEFAMTMTDDDIMQYIKKGEGTLKSTLDGLEVVYTDEYIDMHFVCGTYTIIRNGIVTSETVTFDENVKVSSASQNVFRLVDEKHCESNGLTHNLKLVEGYAATCTETGVADIEKCSNCGASSTRPETIPTVAHTEVLVNKVDATCLSYGSTERTECSICGTVLEKGEIIIPTGHINNNNDNGCDICGMKVEGADAVTDHDDFTEVAVAKGDLVAGKWYRIYRDESTPGCYIDLSTDENSGYLVAYDGNSSYKNATYFYSGPLYIIKGMKFVYTDEYIDFYLEEGIYEIMHHTTGESTGKKLTIDETTTITGFTSGKVFELKQVN